MRNPVYSGQFKRDLKAAKKRDESTANSKWPGYPLIFSGGKQDGGESFGALP
jgi:hypothetical protein